MSPIDRIFYVFYTAYHLKEGKKRWYSTSQGRKADALKAFISIITFYGLLVFPTTLAITKTHIPNVITWVMIVSVAWFGMVYLIDSAIGKRYSDEKLLALDERYVNRISKLQARIIVGIIIVFPFVLMFFLPGVSEPSK